MAAEAHSPHPLAAREATDYLPITLIREYAYCPTLAYLKAATIWEPETYSMRAGREAEPRLEVLAARIAGGEPYRLLRGVRVYSRRLRARGVIDAVIETPSRLIPVEAKTGLTPRSIYTRRRNALAQVVAYAMALEETLGKPVTHAALVDAETLSYTLVKIEPWMRTWVQRIAEELHHALETGEPPRPTPHRRRCKACWYHSICPYSVSSVAPGNS